MDQLRSYVRATGSTWSILADPNTIRIFRDEGMDTPVAEIPTASVLEAVGASDVRYVGEAVLLIALRRWLENFINSTNNGFKVADELREFVAAVRETNRFEAEYSID